MTDLTQQIQAEVEAAHRDKTPVRIAGGGSKDFYGRRIGGKTLSVAGHRGIVNYEPTELVVTARAGTPLQELEAILAAQNQMLPFEPPHFGAGATLGGTIACGLSGPRRPFAGSARDFVLGTRIINGRAEVLRFGGEVMKNVAGYDVSRLMTGALGTLGVLLDVSLKVLPRPEQEITLTQTCSAGEALTRISQWMAQPLPLSAACHDEGRLHVRLSGTARAVAAGEKQVGGDRHDDASRFWHALREQTLPFFADATALWRIAVPAATPMLDIPGQWLLDWGGAQRWLVSDADPAVIWASVAQRGGHATLFRSDLARDEVFQPLAPGLQRLHRNLKRAFDPDRILNPGKMYHGL